MICKETVYSYCKEDVSLIENYEQAINDKTQTWHCHHRLETDLSLSADELVSKGLYYDRPANELIFLTPSEHMRIHTIIFNSTINRHIGEKNSMYGRNHKEESKQLMSKTRKEKFNNGELVTWNKGKKCEQFTGENNAMYGVSPKERMDEKTYKQWKEKITNTIKDRRSMYKDGVYKMIKKEDIDTYLNDGWVLKGKPAWNKKKNKLTFLH